MPQELLALIKALNIAKENKTAIENMTLKDLLGLAAEEPKEECKPSTNEAYIPVQAFTSYKVRSLDGSITALDLSQADLAQYNATDKKVSIVWAHTSIEFDADPESEGPRRLSNEEFKNLVNFIAK